MGKLGLKSKCYYRSAGSYNSPTFTEIDIISDFGVKPAWDGADANSRESRIKFSMKTLLGLEFTGKIKKKPGHAAYEAIMDALVSDEVLDVLILDGPDDAPGTRGWRLDVQVHGADEDQGLGSVLYDDITFKPYPGNPPKAVKVSDGTTGPELTYATPGESEADFE